MFFSENIPIPYETETTEHGVKSASSDSQLPVCSPIALLVNSNLWTPALPSAYLTSHYI